MASVDWIRLSTSLFENPKIKVIETYPKGDSLVSLWIRLLCMAGRINNQGMVYIAENVPYTPEMLAAVTGKPKELVKQGLELFQQLDMISVGEKGFIEILGWNKHQNVEGLDKIREQNKLRQRKHRAKKVSLDKCVYCGEPATGVDHIIPKSKGGSDDDNNLVPCCSDCNMHKMTQTVTDFLNQQLFNGEKVDIESVTACDKLKKYTTYNCDKKKFVTVVTRDSHTKCHGSHATDKIREDKIRIEDDYHHLHNDDDEKCHAKCHTEIFALWEKNIMPLVPVVAEKLQALLQEVGEAAVEQGIMAAVEHGVRNFSYVQTVARNYVSGKSKPQKEEMPF